MNEAFCYRVSPALVVRVSQSCVSGVLNFGERKGL